MSHFDKRYRAHPWHGVSTGDKAPEEVTAYIEILPTDTVKYEVDKETGFLRVDRPQKFSNHCPTLYGFIPMTYCDQHVCKRASERSKYPNLKGDKDPLDICILAERPISKADILMTVIPVGGFRMIDDNEADEKIIAVLKGDLGYGEVHDVHELPPSYIARLRHYFLTYKHFPNNGMHGESITEITELYGREEAHNVINLAIQDYQHFLNS
jgi:inorganic pyrophosphatase